MADKNEQLALGWVRKEINKSLDQARQGLESFAENEGDVTHIRFCISCLHQVRGTLQMLEFHGAALFAEEMEHLAQALAEGKFVAKDKALEVLMASMLQLPTYLDRVQQGRKDLPVILLPLLNELRASRGASPVSESVIFTPQLAGVEPPKAAGKTAKINPKTFPELAKKFRMHYQKGLLGVMRNENVKEGIQRMHKVLEKLEETTSGFPVSNLWWIADGFLFSILEKGLFRDPAVHALLGQIDRQIKSLSDFGTEALNDTIPDDLLRSLLYYVAKSTSKNEKVVRLKEQFQLDKVLPNEEEVETERRRMRGPDSGAIETVVKAINEDLINVKDSLDLFVRGGDKSASKLKSLIPSLKKITDTLGILGLGIPRDVIKQQIVILTKAVDSGESVTDAMVMDVAGALLFVEANMSNIKLDEAVQEELSPEELAAKQDQVSQEAQLDDAKMHLLKASRANIQKAKEKIVDFIASSFDFSLVSDVPVLLTEVQGGLQIVGFTDASDLLDKAHEFIEKALLAHKLKPAEAVMDALADIITTVEYCIENFNEIGSAAFDSVIGAAKDSETVLADALKGIVEIPSVEKIVESEIAQPVAQDLELVEQSTYDEVQSIQPVIPNETLEQAQSSEVSPAKTSAEVEKAEPTPESISVPVPKAHDESLIDEEVLEIFLEEVEEELESINSLYPKLRKNPEDEETLTTIRRSFHTLKGSGRLVGASLAGELAWSVENMLNRVLDHTIALDEAVFAVIGDATAMFPSLIDAFSKNQLPTDSPDSIIANAQAISKGEQPLIVEESAEDKAAAEQIAAEDESVAEELKNLAEESHENIPAQLPEILPEEFAAEFTEVDSFEEETVDEFSEELTEPLDPLDLAEAEELSLEDLSSEELMAEELSTDELSAETDSFELEELQPIGVDDVMEISASLEDQEPLLDELFEQDEDESIELEALGEDDTLEELTLDQESIPTLEVIEEDFDAAFDEEQVEDETFDQEIAELPEVTEKAAEYQPIDENIDPLLLEIFVNEAESHLDIFNEFLSEWDDQQSLASSDDLLRAMHTLKGSANMAEVGTVAELADPLETLVKTYKLRDISLPVSLKPLLSDCAAHLKDHLVGLSNNELLISDKNAELVNALKRHLSEMRNAYADDSAPAKLSVARDPELLAIFLAEGMDIISESQTLLDQWQIRGSIESQHSLQAEMHTLKRGANMAMLEEVEQLASALEKFVSKPDQATNDNAYLSLGHKALDKVMELLNVAATEHELDSPQELVDELRNWHSASAFERVKQAAVEHEEVSETIKPTDVHEAEDEIDEELLEFFLEEAEELIEEIEGHLEVWKGDINNLLPVTNLQRNLHTFKGSARMAGVMGGGNLAHALEDLYEVLASSHIEVKPSHIDLSYTVLDELRKLVAQLREQNEYQINADLIGVIRAAIAGEVTDVTVTSEVSETPAQQSDDEVEPVASEQDQAVQVQSIELDEDGEEVLEIYLEEASEILQSMDEALQVWSKQPTDKAAIETLQRSLHTLKGGARLSNLTALGDLTHELETFFEKVADGQLIAQADQAAFVMKGYDVIHSMVDEVGASRLLTSPVAYMAELDQVIKGKKAKPVAEAPAKPQQQAPEKKSADVVPFQKKQETKAKQKQQDVVRIGADQLESLVNLSGETSIFRARLEQQVSVLRYNLDEMEQALDRLRDQLRNMEIETDAQIEYRREIAGVDYEEFDPLEFDRYTRQQELTRSLGESTADISNLKETIDNLTSDAETLLMQQGRVNTEMQERLMRTRMVPFDSLVPRLRRIVRQIGNELGKAVDLAIVAEGEMDRSVLERMIAPIEHMLRNAMDHGIESTEERKAAGKPETGKVRIRLYREGSEVFIDIKDDGRGLNIDAIRAKAMERGLITAHSELTDHELQQLIFEAGFSTAKKVTQISGRGVGMDVVSSEIKQLGGVVEIHSERGKGATFTVKLPFTVSVNQALMIAVGDDIYAVPLTSIEGIVRVSPFEIQEYYNNPETRFEYAGMNYQMRYMGNLLDHNQTVDLSGVSKPLPVLLLHGAEHPTAVQVDELMGSREIVVKSVGTQLSLLSGLSGATILGDGRVVLILDVPALTRRADAVVEEQVVIEEASITEDKVPTIMVVDDSITVRKVTQRLLQRHDYEVITAKDGVDAISVLSDHKPDVMLLDIEMPRMDGFELATIIRHDEKLKDLPIIMITSRTGEKHRERAESIGVNRYMGKPYNEVDLLQTIESLLPGKN